MWDAKTKIFFLAKLSSQKKKFIDNLLAEFSIPSEGLAIIFDVNDYSDYENHLWRNEGVHINIELGGREDMSPKRLFEIMDSKKYANLIWISNRICSGDPVQFVWVFAHELQHFFQDRICHILSEANCFLLDTLILDNSSIIINELKESMTIPYEFDAELTSFKKVKKLFSNNSAERFIRSQKNYKTMNKLLSYDLTTPYDLVGQTIFYFEKYLDQLENYVKSASDPYIRSFNIARTINELKECLKTVSAHNKAAAQ